MKEFLSKIFGYIIGVILIFPILVMLGLLVTCRNYIWSAVISAGLFYLILGFTGVACFLTLSLTIILSYLGDLTYKKFVETIDKSMEEKLNNFSDEEKAQRKRALVIDDIIGRYGDLG